MPYQYEKLLERRRVAQEYVASIRARTVCERCGSQPVEWHNESHAARPYFRVSTLCILGRSIERIQREIDASAALCRSCHMAVDGRAAALVASRPRKKGDVIVLPAPCAVCRKPYKPLRKGLCGTCYDQLRRPRKDPDDYVSSKVTQAQAEMIRSRFASGETRSNLAFAYDVSWSTIDRIVKNKTKRGKGRMILPTIERRGS